MANEYRKHRLAVDAATAAAADAVAAAAKAVSSLIEVIVEEGCAIRIQSAFRAYLARKALVALKGFVKLQAVIRGQLVRKLPNWQLVNAQPPTRARARRNQMAEEIKSMAQSYLTRFRSLNHDLDFMEKSSTINTDPSNHQCYMAYTESSRAKTRSHKAKDAKIQNSPSPLASPVRNYHR